MVSSSGKDSDASDKGESNAASGRSSSESDTPEISKPRSRASKSNRTGPLSPITPGKSSAGIECEMCGMKGTAKD